MVAAGAIVTRDVAPRMIVAGDPARYLRAVDDGRAQAAAATATPSTPGQGRPWSEMHRPSGASG